MFRGIQLLVVALLITLAVSSAAQAQLQIYSPQSEPAHSFISGWGGEVIMDTEFAQMAAGLLRNGNLSNTYGASFFFQQCYSGGMFNDLEDALGTVVPWVGASSAPHNGVAWGDGVNSFWTQGLTFALETHDTMLGIANIARFVDEAGPNGTEYKNWESPQSLYRNDGHTIDMRDDYIHHHTAILFAGNANLSRHNKGIRDIYKMLKLIYEDSNRPYTILVLGEANALPGIPVFGQATKASLAAAFNYLKPYMNHRNDFFFYGTDHGGMDDGIVDEETPIGGGQEDEWYYRPADDLITAILGSNGIPQLILEFGDLLGAGVFVSVNGIELGDAFMNLVEGKVVFNLSHRLISELHGELNLLISNSTDRTVTVRSATFRSGEIDTLALVSSIPEPTTACLLLLPLALLRPTRRRAA